MITFILTSKLKGAKLREQQTSAACNILVNSIERTRKVFTTFANTLAKYIKCGFVFKVDYVICKSVIRILCYYPCIHIVFANVSVVVALITNFEYVTMFRFIQAKQRGQK